MSRKQGTRFDYSQIRRGREPAATGTPADANDPLVLPMRTGFAARACDRSKPGAARRMGLPALPQWLQPKIALSKEDCGFRPCFRFHDRGAACGRHRANLPGRLLFHLPSGAPGARGRPFAPAAEFPGRLRRTECSARSASRSRPSIFGRAGSRWKSRYRRGRLARCGRSDAHNRRRDGERQN